ncbi:MAG: type II secretion system F family protein [Pirellulaceae bacterium]|nr:type II secretion system F family protein [Pirellulaceae bacterium]
MSRSESDALQATRQLADLTRAGLPLSEGLRAAADELGSGRLSRMFRQMARDSESGQPLEEILHRNQQRLPPHIVGLVQAARRTGHLEQALTRVLEQQLRLRELSRRVTAALTYPVFVLGSAVVLLMLLQLLLLGQLTALVADLELADDHFVFVTRMLVWWHEGGSYLVGGAVVVLLVLALLIRLVLGRAVWRRMLATIPLLGPIWHWAGVAQWSRLLGLLVEQQIPLPDALRLAASGSFDANVAEVSRQLASGADQGRLLSEMLASTYRLPASLVPLVRWGEQSGDLAGALNGAADMFEGRLRLRSGLLRLVLPPMALLLIAAGVALLMAALFLPLIELIQVMEMLI